MNNLLDQNLMLKDKKVLLRVDVNVPMKNRAITEISRIEKIIPTIKLLIEKQAKIIVLSHIGRPKGKIVEEMSLEPISKKLAFLLNKEVLFNKNIINENTLSEVNKIPSGSIMMLENIRFNEGEESNDIKFSKKLSNLGDMYVNDAFSCSHRAHASIEGITKYIPSYFGLQITEEISALKKITSKIKKPVTLIIGGSKISTKIGIIKNLIPKFNNIIIVGGMANNILNFNGNKIGKSIKEDNCEKIINEIFDTSKKYSCLITYPEDVMVGKHMEDKSKKKELDEITDDDLILDIGPKTIKKIKDIIEKSKTVLWNGPAGYFENESFMVGTMSIAENISKNTMQKSLISILGGGDTLAAINKSKNKLSFTHLSTAGGAFLEYLEGKDLPGLSVLK